MLTVKYTKRCSNDGYEYEQFNNYDEFGRWIADCYNLIFIWNIEIS